MTDAPQFAGRGMNWRRPCVMAAGARRICRALLQFENCRERTSVITTSPPCVATSDALWAIGLSNFLGVDESLFFTCLHFAQDANGGQLFQVARGGLALGHVFLDQVAGAGGVQAQGGRRRQWVPGLVSASSAC